MTSRVGTLVGHDIRLQKRYGIYYAYAFVALFYVAILASLGGYLSEAVVAVVIFTDPSALGFFFLGALVMLEKGEGTRTALAVTPVSAADYLAAKATTLTAIALVAVSAIAAFVHREANFPLLAAATALTSVQYIGIGVPIALRFRSVTAYLLGSAALLTPFLLPAFLALMESVPLLLYLIPGVSQLRLTLVALGGASASAAEIAMMLAVSTLAAAAAFAWGTHAMAREFGRR